MTAVRYLSKLPRLSVMTFCAWGLIAALYLVEDLFPQGEQLLPACLAALDRVPERLRRGLLHRPHRDRRKVDDVIKGVLEHLPARLVLDLRRLLLELGRAQRM